MSRLDAHPCLMTRLMQGDGSFFHPSEFSASEWQTIFQLEKDGVLETWTPSEECSDMSEWELEEEAVCISLRSRGTDIVSHSRRAPP